MDALDLAAFRDTPLVREPFEYLVLPGFVKTEARAAINAILAVLNATTGVGLTA